MTTIEYLKREIHRTELSIRQAHRKPNTPFEEIEGLCEKLKHMQEALKAVEELDKVTAERDAAQRLLAEHTGVVGMEKVTTCFGYSLDKVLELVLADQEGRLVIRPGKSKEARP